MILSPPSARGPWRGAWRGLPALPAVLLVGLVGLLQTLQVRGARPAGHDQDSSNLVEEVGQGLDLGLDLDLGRPRHQEYDGGLAGLAGIGSSLNPVRNFIATDTLVDGERERRIHVHGITAKETTIGTAEK